MLEKYKDIIQHLSDGINPFTGEVFDSNHICQNTDIARALMASVKVLEKEIAKSKRKKDQPSNAGKGWSKEEDIELITKFEEGVSLKELATNFERSTGSIRSRLLNHGVITNTD